MYQRSQGQARRDDTPRKRSPRSVVTNRDNCAAKAWAEFYKLIYGAYNRSPGNHSPEEPRTIVQHPRQFETTTAPRDIDNDLCVPTPANYQQLDHDLRSHSGCPMNSDMGTSPDALMPRLDITSRTVRNRILISNQKL